jgi:hypothetical protein
MAVDHRLLLEVNRNSASAALLASRLMIDKETRRSAIEVGDGGLDRGDENQRDLQANL